MHFESLSQSTFVVQQGFCANHICTNNGPSVQSFQWPIYQNSKIEKESKRREWLKLEEYKRHTRFVCVAKIVKYVKMDIQIVIQMLNINVRFTISNANTAPAKNKTLIISCITSNGL